MITSDSGYVAYNKDKDIYFCGLNTWDKQLRKAKIYHSDKWLREIIDEQTKKSGCRIVALKVSINIVN